MTRSAARTPAKDSDTSDSSNSSDDDAPLATLVQPRRPGSSTSNASGRSLPPKPLIDIRSLSNSPLSNSSPVSVNPSPIFQSATPVNLRIDVRSPTNINERLSNLTQGLTRPKPMSPVVPDPTVNASDSQVPPTTTGRTAPSRSMTAPPIVVPSVEKTYPTPDTLDGDTPVTPKSPAYSNLSDSAATIPSANTTEFPPIRGPRTSLSLDDPTPIKPTPIHHRVPQSGFSVMSRPHHHSTTSASMSAVPSTNSSQKQVDGESPDSIGDFTAAMFSQFDLGLSPDESQGSLDNTITKAAVIKNTAKSTVASSAILHRQTTLAPSPTTRTVNPIGQKESTPTRPILSDVSSTPSSISVSESMTSSPRIVGQPRSSTSISSQSAQPPNDQPQLQTVPRSHPLRAAKNTALGVSGPRKAAATTQIQPPPPSSRHKRAPATGSTSSESSESSSPAPSIAPKKQKQPHPQLRPQQAAQRPRSFTMNTLTTTNLPSPKSSTNNPSSPALNRPPQRPFAMRDNSPSSSTGDSSSGRLPITPRDGSEGGSELGWGVRGKQQPNRNPKSFRTEKDGLLSVSNSEMGLRAKKLAHRKSASYDDSTLKAAIRGGGATGMTDEERRRERRRSEAKNAIEV